MQNDAEAEIRRMSRRSFLWAGVALVAGYTGWSWLSSRRTDDGVPWPLRRVLEVNEEISRDLFSSKRLAPAFPKSAAGMPRQNGTVGMEGELDLAAWKLRLEGVLGAGEPVELTMDDIRKFPRVEMVTELKCIEGWSQVVHWAGARFLDMAAKYPPITPHGDPPDTQKPEEMVPYVGIETPDGGYYVGLDMESALHPQTLLCYEMNGQSLTPEHGAPLRLAIPVKYGIKNIKRIGVIRYTAARPRDFWAEQGYDWYAGH